MLSFVDCKIKSLESFNSVHRDPVHRIFKKNAQAHINKVIVIIQEKIWQ